MENLLKKAESLAGRPVEVEKLSDGKFIVLWMSFASPPPPKEDTPEKALESFIDMMLRIQTEAGSMTSEPIQEGDSDGSHSGDTGSDHQENQGV